MWLSPPPPSPSFRPPENSPESALPGAFFFLNHEDTAWQPGISPHRVTPGLYDLSGGATGSMNPPRCSRSRKSRTRRPATGPGSSTASTAYAFSSPRHFEPALAAPVPHDAQVLRVTTVDDAKRPPDQLANKGPVGLRGDPAHVRMTGQRLDAHGVLAAHDIVQSMSRKGDAGTTPSLSASSAPSRAGGPALAAQPHPGRGARQRHRAHRDPYSSDRLHSTLDHISPRERG
jgi:hypothetical protein